MVDHHLLLLLLLLLQAPAVAIPTSCLLSEESKDNSSGVLVGVSHSTAAVLAPGSTTTHTKTVASTLGQKMSFVMKLSPAVPSGPSQGKSVKCCLGHGEAEDCPMYTNNGTKALLRQLHKSHEAQ